MTDETNTYTEIGKGTFGIIFQADQQRIVKRTLKPNIDIREWLAQDAKWHARIFASRGALGKHLHLVNVPTFFGLSESSDNTTWLDASATVEDLEYRTKSPILQAQRIPAIPKSISKIVLEKLLEFEGEMIQRTVESAQNQNCLFRIYFGKAEQQRARRLTLAPSLRNFSLGRTKLAACLSPGDYKTLLEMLARTMAYLHWYVGCDARDVEFVLGGTNEPTQIGDTFDVFGQHTTAWLLDFNQVTEISMDAAGAEKAALAFLDNDPYFPKANRDTNDWAVFRSAYLDTSEKVQKHKATTAGIELVDSHLALPSMFCNFVERLIVENVTLRSRNHKDEISDD